MKFLHVILISLLLASCVPSTEQMTATATTEAAQTLTAVPTITVTHTSTPTLTTTVTNTPSGTSIPDGDPVLVGSGDIAHCSSKGDEATAELLDSIPGTEIGRASCRERV